jgi:hypothetical protein
MSTRPRSKTRTPVRLFCALLGMLAAGPDPQAQRPSEYDVEAAYLYNFGKFVRWSPDASSNQKTFDICILGQDPFGNALDRVINGDQIEGRAIRERTLARASDAAGCAIVYIADSEEKTLRRTIAILGGKGQLLVSTLPHFLEQGGMIQFVIDEDRVRFAVNLDTVANSGLSVSSELLKVAVKVVGKPREGLLP